MTRVTFTPCKPRIVRCWDHVGQRYVWGLHYVGSQEHTHLWQSALGWCRLRNAAERAADPLLPLPIARTPI